MAHKMLVESDPHETRVAVLEEDLLTEIYLERRYHRGVVGNIYKGRVSRVLPGMQAAFVDIGLDRDAFLYVADVYLPSETDAAATVPSVAGALSGEDEVELEPHGHDDDTLAGETVRVDSGPLPTIDSLLKVGQELLVQVTKDPLPNKGARVTTQVTLPGRFVVFLPTVSHVGVSRKIEDEEERLRLRGLLESIPHGAVGNAGAGGVIVRTAGEGRSAADFATDLAYLRGRWESVHSRAETAVAPALMHQDFDLALRLVRDLFSAEFSLLWVDSESTYERIVEFLDQVQPQLVPRVKLDREERGLFERFGIEKEIEAALKPKVWLKSGGYLVINPTEALVAIDVNTGRFVGQHNLEETALAANLEAVEEVVRQIRLRDLGGIIVLDLIDMTDPAHREQVSHALELELRKDRGKHKVLSISEFGLVQITRKRSRSNLERLLTQTCPYCEGSGRIKSVATICLSLRRSALAMRGTLASKELLVRVHPEVARMLQREERGILEELERELAVSIIVQGDAKLHHSSFDILEV
ncbi:MAG: Rne/Rng family ribonuclease [Thermoanaerobaculia bacterium]|nr:Rne/Rng family ribonuclease [Thermoanaerobaculia bacterium]MBP9822642.1 Rne/Rng family ribonuclease [Thermoanaerobaculia bacterium]